MRATDVFLPALMLFTAACNGASDESASTSNPPYDGPLIGSFNGASFSMIGSIAQMSATQSLKITLASKDLDCEGGVHPVNGTMVVDVAIPPSAQKPGTCALGLGDGACSTSVTTFDQNADGTPHQTNTTIVNGSVHVVSITETSLEANLDVDADGVLLKGKFIAPRCQQ